MSIYHQCAGKEDTSFIRRLFPLIKTATRPFETLSLNLPPGAAFDAKFRLRDLGDRINYL